MSSRIRLFTVERDYIVIQGQDYPFRVVKASLNLELPGFAGILEDGTIFISEEVPLSYRRFIIMHEVWEQGLPPSANRCLLALKEELLHASVYFPHHQLHKYYCYRRRFFERLIQYYEQGGLDATTFYPSLDYLKKLCPTTSD